MTAKHLLSSLTIRSRLIALVLSAIFPLLALLVVDVVDDRQQAIDSATDDVRGYAAIAAERQSRVFGDARILLSTLAATPGLDVSGSPACVEAVTKAANLNPQFMTLGVVNADGMVVCHSKLRNQIKFGDLDLLQTVLASRPGDFAFGRVMVGRATGRPTIVTALPLSAAGAAVDGLVFASIDLSNFSTIAERSGDGGERSVLVIDATDGQVAAGAGDARPLIGSAFADHPLVAALRAAPLGGTTSLVGLQGRHDIFGFAPLHVSGKSRPFVVVGVSRDLALAAADQFAAYRLAIAIAVALTALAAAWRLGIRTLADPIRRLTVTAEAIGEGDLSARAAIEPWQAREMRSLGATLNHMAERLDSATRQLEALANEDGLTGLANRRRFDSVLASECRRADRTDKPLSLLMIDVDFFKSYNDTYGHFAGDDCLKRLAVALKSCASRPGDLVARYGGEELALVLPNTDGSGAETVAAHVMTAIRELAVPHAGSPERFVTVSIGSVSTFTKRRGGATSGSLIRLADQALYTAKQTGRNRHCAQPHNGLSLIAGDR